MVASALNPKPWADTDARRAGRPADLNSPGLGRISKAQKTSSRLGPNPSDPLKSSYVAVCTSADRLFSRIRQAVVSQSAPATLKSAFLDPVSERLATELATELFARKDEDFMAMFTGALGF